MHDGTCRSQPPTFVSLLQAVHVQLIARLFARVLLKWPEGLQGGLDASPRSQRLLLETGGGWRPRWQRGIVGGRGRGFGGGVAAVEQSLSVFRSQQLHD